MKTFTERCISFERQSPNCSVCNEFIPDRLRGKGRRTRRGAGGETWASLAGIKIVTVQEERGEEVGIVMAGTGRGKGVG